MKLTFTLEELKDGLSVRRIGEKRLAEIKSELVTLGAFSLTPIYTGAQWVSGVFIDGIEASGKTGFQKIALRPVTTPIFEVHEKGGDLNALVLELSGGRQLQIDARGFRDVRSTLRGPGADPDMVYRAEVAFGRLVATDSGNPIVRAMIDYLKGLKP
jgi:hypothetical protein